MVQRSSFDNNLNARLRTEVWELTVKVGLSAIDDVADSTTEVADSTSSTMSPLALPKRTAPVYRAEERTG